MSMECQTVDDLIRWAYLRNGMVAPLITRRFFAQPIKGSPAWINSDRYTIDAKAEGPQSLEIMRGPMLQALLEERFKLKIRRETQEIPVYELTVAKGGPKLQVAKEGSCVQLNPDGPLRPSRPGELHTPACGALVRSQNPASAPSAAVYGATVADLCRAFSMLSDREIVDKTALVGTFDIRLALSLTDLFPARIRLDDPDTPPAPTDQDGPPLSIALQKLGLKLAPAKGFGDFLVIDHVEKPSEN
jgi:uncharacterized protein (TIGR03435 family)